MIVDAVRTVKLPTAADNEAAVSMVVATVTIFPKFADKLLIVIVDAARTVKPPTGADNDAAVSVVVVRETTSPRFADKLEVVSDVKLPTGAENARVQLASFCCI